MESVRQRLIDDITEVTSHDLTAQMSAEALESVTSALDGPTEQLVPGNDSSTRVSSGIDAIVGRIESAVRDALLDAADDQAQRRDPLG